MDTVLEKYYEDRFEMFSSKGWKDLVEDLYKMKEATSDVSNYNDNNQLWKAKGEVSLINWILNLEELTKEAYNGLKED